MGLESERERERKEKFYSLLLALSPFVLKKQLFDQRGFGRFGRFLLI